MFKLARSSSAELHHALVKRFHPSPTDPLAQPLDPAETSIVTDSYGRGGGRESVLRSSELTSVELAVKL